MIVSRRSILVHSLAALGASVAGIGHARAGETPIELEWSDLVPNGGGKAYEALRNLGVVQHGELSTPFDQETDAEVTDKYDGQLVRIPGYLVPLDFEGTGVTAALLVPYVGACIHVPPPPPNQLIYVTTSEPYESAGLFEPVFVTGIIGAGATATQLAEIGYALSADTIEPYG